jgi:uncharacterized protein (DUF924 family)
MSLLEEQEVADILAFWFDETGKQDWFDPSSSLDESIRFRFEAIWHRAKDTEAGRFAEDPEQALAAIILFDQFPRNMFRDSARAFETDGLAREIARLSIDAGYDARLSDVQRQFLYMPFMHSEDLVDQKRSLTLFDTLEEREPFQFAVKHYELIAQFGRFPHRNAVLGRETLPQERDAVKAGEDW